MKKIIVLFLSFALLSISAMAQTKLSGGVGLTFGSNMLTVKSIMLQKGGTLDEIDIFNEFISFFNVPVGTKKADMIACQFVNNKLHTIKILFHSQLEAKTQNLYDEVVSTITTKYGKPKISRRSFTGIYEDGDGYEMQAIRLGEADISSYWFFDDNNAIGVQIQYNNIFYVQLTYQNTELMDEVEIKDKERDNRDF